MDHAQRYLGVMQRAPAGDFLNRRLALDRETWLPDQMLTKVDRATMARGLEARVPFLDHRLAEFAARLPQRTLLGLFTLKRFLKLAFRELLPAEIRHRRKHGFEVPVDEWLRGPLRDFMRSALEPARIARHGLYDAAFAAELQREHAERRRNRSKELFLLLVFELWYEKWMARPQ